MIRLITTIFIVVSLLSNFTYCSKSSKNDNNKNLTTLLLGIGSMFPEGWLDVHGAGAQRSDPKSGNPTDYPKGRGPQGDAIRIYNYVRLVRGSSTGSYTIVDTCQTKSFNTTAEITAPTSWVQMSVVQILLVSSHL
jgi:hypothetical protein